MNISFFLCLIIIFFSVLAFYFCIVLFGFNLTISEFENLYQMLGITKQPIVIETIVIG